MAFVGLQGLSGGVLSRCLVPVARDQDILNLAAVVQCPRGLGRWSQSTNKTLSICHMLAVQLCLCDGLRENDLYTVPGWLARNPPEMPWKGPADFR